MIKKNDKIAVKFKGGGSIISIRPVFSQDGRFVYIAWKNQILCYNTKTAKRVSEFQGLNTIVGFGCVLLNNDEHLVACSQSGKLMIWKAELGLKIKELKLAVNHVTYFRTLPVTYDTFERPVACALLASKHEGKGQNVFVLANLETGDLDTLTIGVSLNPQFFVDVGGYGSYVAVVQGRKLRFSRFGSKKVYIHSIYTADFTCVACHPEEEIVLVGDSIGRVLVWSNLTSARPSPAVYHWHALPIRSLCFSTSGTHFYSGGAECVLVKWQLNDQQNKNYLPRLSSPIQQISVAEDNLFVAVATDDNGIQILDSQFDRVNVIQHLVLGSDASAGVVYDPRSKALVLNGVPGHLQFFSPKDMSLLYNLDVVGQNAVTGDRDKNIVNTLVTKVCIDKTGLWAATVEYRDDPDFPESRLKFWFFNSVDQCFTLNTSVDYPHDDKINDVCFQPSHNEYELLCVTVGKDKKFKLWKVTDASTNDTKVYHWQCSGVAYYRDLMPNTLSFSSDGSLLAIAFGSIATAWLPQSCEIKCSLKHSVQNDDLIHLSFGVGTQCHLLVTATSKHISAWNLLTLSMVWTLPTNVTLIISDAFSSYKAAFTANKKVFIFEPHSPNAIYSNRKMIKNLGDVTAATFVPNSTNSDVNLQWIQQTTIYFLDSNHEMYSIESADQDMDVENSYSEGSKKSLFNYMLPTLKSNIIPQLKKTHMYSRSTRLEKLKELLDSPAHTMAPLHLTCEAILSSMILESQKDEPIKEVPQQQSVSRDDEDDNVLSLFDEDSKVNLSKVRSESTAWTSVL